MATWTTVPDSSLEPGKPIRSIDAIALRDNPVAIAEGASGAPKIDPFAAFAHNGQAGAVGTYVFAKSNTTSDVDFGATRAGSALFPTGALTQSISASDTSMLSPFEFVQGSALAGTWRCMGYYDYTAPTASPAVSFRSATLWLRIA